jgi:hypothetical protein
MLGLTSLAAKFSPKMSSRIERNGTINSFTSGLYYKYVTIVIYDHNDSGLYYKTYNLALARNVNYGQKVAQIG